MNADGISNIPALSIFFPSCVHSVEGKNLSPRIIANIPNGILIRKIHRHVATVKSHPASTGPRDGATIVGIATIPVTTPTLSAGLILKDKEKAIGIIIPPPRPCKILQHINIPGEMLTAHRQDPSTKHSKHVRKTFL